MKTAKDWIDEADANENIRETATQAWRIGFTQRIQLDAFKAGMKHAAEIAERQEDKSCERRGIKQAIFTTAEQLKELP